MNTKTSQFAAVLLLLAAAQVNAAVTPEEAQALKASLTPYGAERAGNAQGTIPAWDGKAPAVNPDAKGRRIDPYAGEKPRLVITAANLSEHAQQLSEGTKALFAKQPAFKIDVYPSHRTAHFSQGVYEQVFKNATRAKLANDGLTVEGAFGGIPFPIPKDGNEALWNHALSYRGQVTNIVSDKYVMTASGDRILTARSRTQRAIPFYDPAGASEQGNGEVSRTRIDYLEPAAISGQSLLSIEYVDSFAKQKDGWQYLPGQRRVRKSPSISHDAPDASGGGLVSFDDVNLFQGEQDQYHIKLLGKRELIIPANNNGLFAKASKDVVHKGLLAPEAVRWELRRVWVVEMTLKEGKRNVQAKRRLYLDEDTWQAVVSESWDAQGKLWRTGQAHTLLASDQPMSMTVSYVIYDLQAGAYVYAAALHDTGGVQFSGYTPRELSRFSSAALSSGGVR
ncbi:DUF1329 domain-containing protein [Pantoea sp. 18069]|uniref:DUF1329 domain-containing protein n=1 Tax=Pantoea sp. 18069 TaxID=2681415 RepID=UPI001357A24C|nr:DUF1329 domain-containing protein [Pantoea sp. 18069]